MKKLLLTIILLTICGSATATNLKKGVWIDLTPCEKLANKNPVCTGRPLPKITKKRQKSTPIVQKEKTVAKNTTVSIPVPRYIGKGKYCYPLPLGDNKYDWKCDKDE